MFFICQDSVTLWNFIGQYNVFFYLTVSEWKFASALEFTVLAQLAVLILQRITVEFNPPSAQVCNIWIRIRNIKFSICHLQVIISEVVRVCVMMFYEFGHKSECDGTPHPSEQWVTRIYDIFKLQQTLPLFQTNILPRINMKRIQTLI